MSQPVQLARPDDLGLKVPVPPGGEWFMLAEGDSWFSFGSVLGNSLLNQLRFTRRTLVVSTSRPGDTLRRMVDWRRDPKFVALVDGGRRGNLAHRFDALLLSAGGNDLIDAAGGQFVDQQLFRRIGEGETPGSAADCLHEDAWQRFEAYLRANFAAVAALVGNSRRNADTPILIHGYDYPTPNDTPTLRGVSGPWLRPAMVAHRIPEALWAPLADLLIDRLAGVLGTLALPNVHFIDTRGTLVRAERDARGASGDWLNEIHPTAPGYAKLARKWQPAVETRLRA